MSGIAIFAAMTTSDLSTLITGVIASAKTVGEFIRSERRTFSYNKAEVKGLNDLVSYVDKSSEQQLVDLLSGLLPEAGFVTEEDTRNEKKEYNWIIDPLDGTTNFIHGIPCYAVSIALEHEGDVILGVVYEVAHDECFSAYKGGGAFMNGKAIAVSERKNLSESLIATGFPIYNFSRLDAYLKALTQLMKSTHGLRRIGSAATDLCYVACGRVDAYFEYNLNAWDVAAGALIVKEAGGNICDFSKGNNWLFGREVIASNKHLQVEFETLVSESFSEGK
jgi:myo-inositol-1(or 4)-monophosphatase